MNIKVRLTTGRKLHALAEKNGETMVDMLDKIIEREWQNYIEEEKLKGFGWREYPVVTHFYKNP